MDHGFAYDVFLSHNKADKPAVLKLAKRLKEDGLKVWLDDWVIQPGDNIFMKIEEGLQESWKVVVLLSSTAVKSKWVAMERGVPLFRDPTNLQRRFIPLLLEPCDLPDTLKGISHINYFEDEEAGYQKLLAQFQIESSPPPSKTQTDLDRLPLGSTTLVGRTSYLKQLDECLESDVIAIASLIAAGGVGKSALVEAWLYNIRRRNYGGAEKVFGWSFYSQGNHETQNSSAAFFSEALPFFGHEGALPTQEEEKAKKLATLLGNQQSLLILDGVEPLQYPPETHNGIFKDVGLNQLMRNLSFHGLHNNGKNSLVLITSRQPITSLESQKGRLYQETLLSKLSNSEGVDLLDRLGVKTGLNKEFSETVKEMHGHALGLILLGKMLARYHKGDIAKRDSIKDLFASKEVGDHARKVMAYYDSSALWGESKSHQVFLRLIGLFDRPMEEKVYEILKEKADIAEPLRALDDGDFNAMQEDLKSAGLLLIDEQENRWDTHPLVRDYFGKKLKDENPEEFRQSHQVLFEYFQTVPEDDQPDTLEKLDPLYRAVHHGCRAGEYEKALYDVYFKRIRRGGEHYSTQKLGAYSSDLAALSGFFPDGWLKPPVSEGLSEDDQAWLLADAAFCLMSLGRMPEAVGPRRQGMLLYEQLEIWKNASINATSLCNLLIATGQLAESLKIATQGKQWAEKSGDLFLQMVLQTKLATTLHRLGRIKKSRTAFEEAERLQVEGEPEVPRLYSLQGKYYCDLLLEQAQERQEFEDVLSRAVDSSKQPGTQNHLISIALDHLTQGRALAKLGQTEEAEDQLNKAVAGIHKAGMLDRTPEFFLHRATFRRDQENHEAARMDMEEGLEISERCGMILYEADLRLLEGHMLLDEKKIEEAEIALLRAEDLIHKIDYGQIRPQAEKLRKRFERMKK